MNSFIREPSLMPRRLYLVLSKDLFWKDEAALSIIESEYVELEIAAVQATITDVDKSPWQMPSRLNRKQE